MFLLCHPWFTTTNLSYTFPIFETSATASCGSTCIWLYVYRFILIYIHHIHNIYIYTIFVFVYSKGIVVLLVLCTTTNHFARVVGYFSRMDRDDQMLYDVYMYTPRIYIYIYITVDIYSWKKSAMDPRSTQWAKVTLQGTITYPTLGKGNSSSKCHFWGIC